MSSAPFKRYDAATSGGRGAPGPSSSGRDEQASQRKFDPQIFPTKPATCTDKVGSEGSKVELSANYFPVQQSPRCEIHQFNVRFEPAVDEKMTRVRLAATQKERFGTTYIYNGGSLLYTFHAMQSGEFQTATPDGAMYIMEVTHRGRIDMTSVEALQVMNILLRRTMKGLELQTVGRHLFDASNKTDIAAHKVELWPGFITSVRHHEENMLMCCEVAHRVMRRQTALELLVGLKNKGGDFMNEFKKQIIGTTVLTQFNNQTYRIDDVNTTLNPTHKFKKRDGTEQSIGQYYKSKYDIGIIDKGQPLLVSRPTRKDQRGGSSEEVLLVPELCRLTGITADMRSNFGMMRELAIHTQLPPQKRVEELKKFANSINTKPKCHEVLKGAEMRLAGDLVSFHGRQLKQEEILFAGGKSYMCDDKVDWQQQFRNSKLFKESRLDKDWAIIYPSSLENQTKEFIKSMQKAGTNMNFIVDFPTHRFPLENRPNAKEYVDAVKTAISRNPKLIFIVIQNLSTDIYSAVKKVTFVQHSVPSQVVLGKSVSNAKGLMSIATKVCIQLNCKLGGAPWMVKYPLSNTMTVGFDVTHDTINKGKSIGAFVASMDLRQEVKYYSSVIEHQGGGEELSANLCVTLGNAIEHYAKLHGVLPEKLFFYRDGVGDGQIEQVHQIEMQEMKKQLQQLRTKYNNPDALKLTFVIVNKRINTRIFLRGGRGFENPKPGTIVDNTITLPERYDFYLVSQSVRNGTVTPTSYNVIEDEVQLTPGKLQTLTYKNCHLYYNWSGTVRVPAVVQYAHKLAFLVGQHIHEVPKVEMGESGSLYFL